jgi:hypothetical protein
MEVEVAAAVVAAPLFEDRWRSGLFERCAVQGRAYTTHGRDARATSAAFAIDPAVIRNALAAFTDDFAVFTNAAATFTDAPAVFTDGFAAFTNALAAFTNALAVFTNALAVFANALAAFTDVSAAAVAGPAAFVSCFRDFVVDLPLLN